jgi:hypothetical protein
MEIGFRVHHLIWHGALFVRKKDVAPVLDTAMLGSIMRPRA